MDEIIIRNSRAAAVIGLIIFAPFTIFGVYSIFAGGGNALMNWAIALLFGTLSALCLYLFFDRRPRIIINQNGISDRKLTVGTIDWRDIAGVTTVRAGNTNFIQLRLFEPEKYRSKMSTLGKLAAKVDTAVGLDGVSINVNGVDRTPEDIANLIVNYAQHAAQNRF